MNKSLLLFIATLATTYAVTFDTTMRCACEELSKTECVGQVDYCKWTTTCESVDYCSTISPGKCNARYTDFLCGLEGEECVRKSYTCEDFTKSDDCQPLIDCYWNKDSKCASFSTCADYTTAYCDYLGCSSRSGTCVSFTCSQYTSENDCYGQDTKTTRCQWTNDGKCQSLSNTAICTDLSNYKKMCESNGKCKYASSACSFKTCSDKDNERSCDFVSTSATERKLCAWSGTACVDAADTSKLTMENCFYTTQDNYRWTADGKCQECTNLVSVDLQSNAIILSVFFALALIA